MLKEEPSRLPAVITRSSKLPLHQQLYDLLRAKIRSGEWKEGQMVPAEPELINQYGVSRIVVRQVFNRLVSEGLIYRQQGRGSFVTERTLEEGLTRIISFTEDMKQHGLTPKTRILSVGLVPAREDTAQYLGIDPGEELARLERLRIANDEPMSIEESYLVHRFCPGVLYECPSCRACTWRSNDQRSSRRRDHSLAGCSVGRESNSRQVAKNARPTFIKEKKHANRCILCPLSKLSLRAGAGQNRCCWRFDS